MRESILNYVHHLEEAGYVHDLLRPAGPAGLLAASAEMLRSGRRDEAGAAMLLVLDVALHNFMPENVTDDFRRAILASGFLEVLGEALHGGVYINRWNAMHTLGRLGFLEGVPLLAGVVDRYMERDPLLVPGLIRELIWLGRYDDDRPLIERAASHPNYLFRWSAVTFLAPPYGDASGPEYESEKRPATTLSEDPSPPVRAEARYFLERMVLREAGSQLTKAESKKRYRAIRRQFEPPETFAGLGIAFWATCDGPDYTVAELDAFVRGRGSAGK